MKDQIVGAELAGLERGRDEFLQKQAQAPITAPEDQLTETVRAALHGTRSAGAERHCRPQAKENALILQSITAKEAFKALAADQDVHVPSVSTLVTLITLKRGWGDGAGKDHSSQLARYRA